MTLEVTQEDREAYLALNMLPEFDAADVRAGRWDGVTGVQAFAAHRQAVERKVVEWLRRQHEAVQAFQEYAPRNLSEVADAIERGEHRL